MHYGGDDWSAAQIAGLTQRFGELGIEIVATTDANFEPEHAGVARSRPCWRKNPSIIVSIPTDPVATKDAYKKAAAQGVKLVFMDNVPNDMVAGTDYVSVVSADNRGNGVVSAHLAAQAMGCEGTIGLIYHEADFFVTRDRYDGFKTTIQEQYPEHHDRRREGRHGLRLRGPGAGGGERHAHQDPGPEGDLGRLGRARRRRHRGGPRGQPRWTSSSPPRTSARTSRSSWPRTSYVKGLGAQRPFDQGVTEAKLAATACSARRRPSYVALPALPVSHENVLQAWEDVYHVDPPADGHGQLQASHRHPPCMVGTPPVHSGGGVDQSTEGRDDRGRPCGPDDPGSSKSFSGVRVLDGRRSRAAARRGPGLVGGNGAGKSTLMKILRGVHQPDAAPSRSTARPSA